MLISPVYTLFVSIPDCVMTAPYCIYSRANLCAGTMHGCIKGKITPGGIAKSPGAPLKFATAAAV